MTVVTHDDSLAMTAKIIHGNDMLRIVLMCYFPDGHGRRLSGVNLPVDT